MSIFRTDSPSFARLIDCATPNWSSTTYLNIFDRLESSVRSYCRSFPALFERAVGAELFDSTGKRYIDFLAGAGALNYGHNNPLMRDAVVDYLIHNGITHSLDLHTVAKQGLLESFDLHILQPRRLDYRIQFTGPTGANGVEAAIKLVRKVTGRRKIAAMCNGYHGLSAGALAITSNPYYCDQRFPSFEKTLFLPFDHPQQREKQLAQLDWMLSELGEYPAAIFIETIQAEGGVKVASSEWLQTLADRCKRDGILLVVDDIQVGNGRSGSFFSFEQAGIVPDIVVLSKSIGGLGLPLTLLLIRPELDQWLPGEHSGTFRGNNLAFVAARAALDHYWSPNRRFSDEILARGEIVALRLNDMITASGSKDFSLRGRGMIHGLDLGDTDLARRVSRLAYERGLVVELCGNRSTVLKILPPLTIDESLLEEGLSILSESLAIALDEGALADRHGPGPV